MKEQHIKLLSSADQLSLMKRTHSSFFPVWKQLIQCCWLNASARQCMST